MQIRIRHLSRAAPETVRGATHAFAAPKNRYFLDSVPVGVIFRPIQPVNNVFLKPISKPYFHR